MVGNLTPHERTKHIEIDCHFIHEKLLKRDISTPHVSTLDQLATSLPRASLVCRMISWEQS